jgi:hypothetical protein
MSVYLWPTTGAKTTLTDPDGDSYTTEILPIATSKRTVGGTLRSDFAAVKYRWSLKWTSVAGAPEGATWMASYGSALIHQGHCYWQGKDVDDDATYTVRVMEARWYQSSPGRYSVEMVLEQV